MTLTFELVQDTIKVSCSAKFRVRAPNGSAMRALTNRRTRTQTGPILYPRPLRGRELWMIQLCELLFQGIILTGFVMACELFPADMRTFAGMAIELFWATAMCVLALVAYLIRNWHYFQLFISIPGAVTIVLFWSVYPFPRCTFNMQKVYSVYSSLSLPIEKKEKCFSRTSGFLAAS